MRDLRGNILSVSVVLLSIGAVVFVFPYDAMSFRPTAARGRRAAFAAVVSLSEKEESAAMKAAKSSWNAEAGGVRRLRAELFNGELPEAANEPILGFSDRITWSAPEPIPPGLSPYLPSQAASPPKAIKVEAAKAEGATAPAFSREELLKIY